MDDTTTTITEPTSTAAAVPMTWQDAAAGCADLGGGVFVATVGADGRPHVAWVSVGYGDQCLWFSTYADSQKAANLRHAPEVALHWPERPDRLAFARGTVRLVTDRAETDQLWDDGVLPYDPAAFFTGKDDPRLLFGQILPRRIAFRSLFEPDAPPKVWTPS
jgi:general stress protein 26